MNWLGDSETGFWQEIQFCQDETSYITEGCRILTFLPQIIRQISTWFQLQVFVFYLMSLLYSKERKYVFQKSSDGPTEPRHINYWSKICFRIQQVCGFGSTYIFMGKEQFSFPLSGNYSSFHSSVFSLTLILHIKTLKFT